MVQLIKKGGLRERANRSRKYQGSENSVTTLQANAYPNTQKLEQVQLPPSTTALHHLNSIIEQK